MTLNRRTVTPENALQRMEALCARAEHSSDEIRTKLRALGMDAAQTETIIESLKANRFIDDGRFARMFVRDRFRYGRWGRIKIRMALVQKGITAELIEEALQEIDPKEYRRAMLYVLQAKRKALGPEADTYSGRARLMRSVAARGYELSLISAELK